MKTSYVSNFYHIDYPSIKYYATSPILIVLILTGPFSRTPSTF